MKKTRFQCMKEQLLRHLPEDQGSRILEPMQQEYDRLIREELPKFPGMEKHCRNNIFPVAAAYHVLIAQGMPGQQAADLARDTFLELMEAPATAIRKMMKVPGLYRMMPWLWKTMMPKLFSEDSGFRFRFYPTGADRVKFDMLACPYLQICRALDCELLAPTFCTTDDICYGHMHPKLVWNRTGTLARGGDLCDFDLYIQK